MAEYIDRQELIDTINAQRDVAAARKDFIGMSILNYLLDVIKDGDCVPAADVAPVVHGQWVYNPNGMDWNLGAWQCSVCKCNNNNLPGNDKHNPYIFQGSNYCPHCGAKMDEEAHNGT